MVIQSGCLEDKVVLITGAAQGIGQIIAKVFAEAGAAVVISDVQDVAGESTAKSMRNKRLRAQFIKADLRQEKDIKAAVEFTVESYGRLDIVINNARPKLRLLPFVESLEEWDLAMNVLLKAPALIVKYALPYLTKSGNGSIINISSTNAFFISHQPVAYHVAKAALLQLTKFLAYDLGPRGIRVNAICPGLVDLHDRKPLTSDQVNKTITETIVPLKRAASPQDIAEAALFLCMNSSSYITGQVLTVDGGVTLGDHFNIAKKTFR